ncbi:pyrophosphatase PpaX [Niallia sp. Krafla_26]|uniref:pyrophosphatase PpaX n=1 Tax=Niallia sp. Krafla_26 TaxID=3064703 RepID=UPI003D16326B
MDNKITTLLFDLDGTLIDTNELIIKSFLHTLEQYFPGKYQRNDVLPFLGPTLTDTFSVLNPDKVDEMCDVYRTFNKAEHDSLVTEFPGVYNTMKTLKESGFKMAIVTSKMSDVAMMGMKLTKIDSFFDTIVAFEHIEKPKPDPEALFKALEELGSTPGESIMIGDNGSDILAGKNAGMKTVGVSWSIKGREFVSSFEPDYMLEHISDILPIVGVKQ